MVRYPPSSCDGREAGWGVRRAPTRAKQNVAARDLLYDIPRVHQGAPP